MHRSSNPSSLSMLCALAALSLLRPALAEETGESSPLVEKVRHATARFIDINVAFAEGWVPATPYVSGRGGSAVSLRCIGRSYHKLCTPGVVAPMAGPLGDGRIIA
jgi:hypothetical protein